MENSKTNTGTGGICTILFIVFLILKLAGIGSIATWSWWWVASPLWLPLVAIVGFYLVLAIIMFLTFIVTLIFTSKSKKYDNPNEV